MVLGTVELAFRYCLDPVAQGLVAQSQFLVHGFHALPVLDALDRDSCLNSVVSARFGMFISCLSRVTAIRRHL